MPLLIPSLGPVLKGRSSCVVVDFEAVAWRVALLVVVVVGCAVAPSAVVAVLAGCGLVIAFDL